jgi:hypothetical protein
MAVATAMISAIPAAGLTAIQASTTAGNRLSSAGCAQNDDTDTPEGRNSARYEAVLGPVPPVPGHEFRKYR